MKCSADTLHRLNRLAETVAAPREVSDSARRGESGMEQQRREIGPDRLNAPGTSHIGDTVPVDACAVVGDRDLQLALDHPGLDPHYSGR